MAITTTSINFEFNENVGLEDGVVLFVDGGFSYAIKLSSLDRFEQEVVEAAETAIGPFPVASQADLDNPGTFLNTYNGLTLYESLRYKIKKLGATPGATVLDIWNNSVYWDGTVWRRRFDNAPV